MGKARLPKFLPIKITAGILNRFLRKSHKYLFGDIKKTIFVTGFLP